MHKPNVRERLDTVERQFKELKVSHEKNKENIITSLFDLRVYMQQLKADEASLLKLNKDADNIKKELDEVKT